MKKEDLDRDRFAFPFSHVIGDVHFDVGTYVKRSPSARLLYARLFLSGYAM